MAEPPDDYQSDGDDDVDDDDGEGDDDDDRGPSTKVERIRILPSSPSTKVAEYTTSGRAT